MWFMSCAGMKAAFVVCYDHCQATGFSAHDVSPDCDRTAPQRDQNATVSSKQDARQ